MAPSVRWYLADGPPVEAHGMRVQPRSRVLELRGGPFAFVWQRPSSVSVQHTDGSRQRIKIVDYTLIAQIALWLTAAALIIRGRTP